jgi:hypothetical protein
MLARSAVLAVALIAVTYGTILHGQQEAPTIPTATQWTLDAAGPTQRGAVKDVFLMICPNANKKGTGFLLTEGLVLTNAHVVAGCTAEQMVANTPMGSTVHFSKMATDDVVDLALLRPTQPLSGGLQLGTDQDPKIGKQVSTWGYPLTFNGPAPLLSVGFIAGFNQEPTQLGTRPVKHVVVNGAFNPGNSGGPLFLADDNKVIGVVVAKFHLYPANVKSAIDALANMKSGVMYTANDGQGHTTMVTEGQVVGMILEQYYEKTQVMIGEAISVSEVKRFLDSKQRELN